MNVTIVTEISPIMKYTKITKEQSMTHKNESVIL